MAWFPIALTDDEQRIANAERESHPEAHVRRKMLVLWLLHCEVTGAKAAVIAAYAEFSGVRRSLTPGRVKYK